MKITIAYIAEEKAEAEKELIHLMGIYPRARIHKSDRYTPFYHIYLTTKKPQTPNK